MVEVIRDGWKQGLVSRSYQMFGFKSLVANLKSSIHLYFGVFGEIDNKETNKKAFKVNHPALHQAQVALVGGV